MIREVPTYVGQHVQYHTEIRSPPDEQPMDPSAMRRSVAMDRRVAGLLVAILFLVAGAAFAYDGARDGELATTVLGGFAIVLALAAAVASWVWTRGD